MLPCRHIPSRHSDHVQHVDCPGRTGTARGADGRPVLVDLALIARREASGCDGAGTTVTGADAAGGSPRRLSAFGAGRASKRTTGESVTR